MTRPSFQFYPKDWAGNTKLRRCSHAARGAWMDVLCVLHDSDEYGLARYPLAELANAAGAPIKLLRELVDKGVLKGSDKAITEPFVYIPRTGRKDGEPVPLVPEQKGPVWYSSRLVKDEYVRTIRGESSRFGAQDGDGPKATPKASPKPPNGDGSSSSSSSADRKHREPERAARAQAGEDEPPEANGHGPTPAGAVCKAMRAAGFPSTNPGDPRLLALLEQGATEAEFVGIAAEAASKGRGWAWLLTVVEARRRDAAAIALAPAVTTPWHETRSGIEAKGKELGLGAWDEYAASVGRGPSFADYTARVHKAANEGATA